MATKQIQLRGISRTPSDRLTNDGGCAESLNVQLDNTELAPSFYPDDVTASLNIPPYAERIFIHKTSQYEHCLYQYNQSIYAIVNKFSHRIFRLNEGENLLDINSVGNIVIVSTSDTVRYSLWKNDKYEYIGDQLPVPAIQIDVIGNSDKVFWGSRKGSVKLDTTGAVDGRMGIATFNKNDWEKAARGVHEFEETNNYLRQVNEEVWGAVQKTKAKVGKWGFFSCPRLVRYAVKLYDGSYVFHSVPILIGPGADEWISVTGHATPTTAIYSAIDYYINLIYQAKAKLISWDVEGWEDIIAGVDIFISTDITFPHINTSFETCDDGGGNIYFKGYQEKFDKAKEEILSKGTFYLIESIAVNDLSDLKKGIDLHRNSQVEDTSWLVEQERLSSDYMSSHVVIPKTMMLYNNSLLINATKVQFPAPYPLLNGLYNDLRSFDGRERREYEMKFHMRRNNGEKYSVMARNTEGGYVISTPLISDKIYAPDPTEFYARPMAWIAYPDPNCYAVEIFIGGGDVQRIEMFQHPSLSCSYAFIGLRKYFDDPELTNGSDVETDYSEKNTYEVSNQIMLSEINNPFVFPASKRSSLQARVLGMALATTTLSQGQFGQFPLYVFTEDGIWAMETGADGSFVSQKPLSRDVCINPDSITSLDNAVVFVTNQGVMMLQGSQVTNISPFMNGRHYTIEESAKNIINGQKDFKGFIPVVDDETHFMAFVKEAKIAYDYAGRRLIFIKEGEDYQYIYKLDTQTWHKSSYGLNFIEPINSYPECIVRGSGDEITVVTWTVTKYGSQEELDYLAGRIRIVLPDISDEEVSHFLFDGAVIDISDVSEEEREWLVNEMDYYHVETTYTTNVRRVSYVYDFSTILDAAESKTPTKGVIATRPLDLGEPDVFKTITDIRVRGQYPKGAVKFILLGSNDGVKFYTINTLRGKAWKLFRIIILADLQPTDRISWIDVQYETKFTNKLR